MSQDYLSEEEVNRLLGYETVTPDDWAEAMKHQEKADRAPRMSEKSDDEMTLQDWIAFYEYELQQCYEVLSLNEMKRYQLRSFLNVLQRLEKSSKREGPARSTGP